MSNKSLIIIISFLLFCLLSDTAGAVADHSSLFNRATSISTGQQVNASFYAGYDIDCFKFEAPAEGYYVFYSLGNCDTQGYLYGSDQVFLKKADDEGDGNNFSLMHYLRKDQVVYLKVDNKYRVAGEYSLMVRSATFTGLRSGASRLFAPLNPNYADISLPLYVLENGQPSQALSLNMVLKDVYLADRTPLRFAILDNSLRLIIEREVDTELVIVGINQEVLQIPISTYVPSALPESVTPDVTPPTAEEEQVDEVWSPHDQRILDDIYLRPAAVQALPGNLISIPVTISANAGIAAGAMSVSYNDRLLTPQSCTYGEILKASDILTADFNLTYSEGAMRISWVTSDPIYAAGDLFTVQFKVNANAIAATVPINLQEVQLQGYAGSELAYQVIPGQVIIDNYIAGDCNLDGNIDLSDVTLIVQYQTANIFLTPRQLAAADVTGDKIVDGVDALQILQWISGKAGDS